MPYNGPKDYFPPNLVAIGLLDKLCRNCNKAFPEIECKHCEQRLCHACVAWHGNHQTASESHSDLHQTIEAADTLIQDTNPHQHAIFNDIGALAGIMHQKVDDGIQRLTSSVKDKLLMDIDAYRDWSTQFSTKIAEARRIYNESATIIKQPYNNDAIQKELPPMITRCQSIQKDLKSDLGETLPVAKLKLKYDFHDLPSLESCVSIETIKSANGKYMYFICISHGSSYNCILTY